MGKSKVIKLGESNDFSQYPQASNINDDDLFALQREGENYNVDGAQIKSKSADYWYGFRMTIGQSGTSVTAIGRSDLIDSQPVSQAIYPAMIAEDKTEVYKLNPNDLTKKLNGLPSDLSGADGDAQSVIPDYWIKIDVDGATVDIKFSPIEQAGWTKIPKHAKGIYKADEDASGKLRSRSGVTPLTNKTRDYFRQRAAAKGAGWCIEPYFIREADIYLAFSELLNINSQEAIGDGATNADSTDWDNYNSRYPVWTTDGGAASSYGAGTVTYTPGDPNSADVRIGVINLIVSDFVNGTSDLNTEMAVLWWMRDVFGHILEWVDGINIHNSTEAGSVAYICRDPSKFADDTDVDYEVYAQLAEADGYISEFIPGTILPAQGGVSGASSEHVGDRFYTIFDTNPDSGWRVARWGGDLSNGSNAGLCSAIVNSSSGHDNPAIGARLCLIF